ncbi:MAG: 4-amino-4-deoxy-l-arabinose lipid transferase [Pseudomonadota bacterium]
MSTSVPSLPRAPLWQRPAVVLGALALWLFWTAAWRPLLLPDEGRYASVAWEMWRGDPWVPTLNGLPFFHKPPLLYWLDMAAFSVFGVNAFAARIGPALGAFVLGASLYVHLRHWHGERTARVGLVLLATTPFFFVGGQYVNHDMGVAGCITAAVLAAVRGLETAGSERRGWIIQSWLFCGLGVLAKGLIGVVLPGLVVLPWLLAQRRWMDVLRLMHPLGLLVFCGVVLPWMATMQFRFQDFFDYFIIEQHFRRYRGTVFNNQHPAWFYLAVLPLLTLPWSLWLWPALRRFRINIRTNSRMNWQWALYAWWVVAIVGFFSMPRSKLVGYALPALAPWCAFLALVLADRLKTWALTAAASAVLCVAVVTGIAWKVPYSAQETAQVLQQQWRPGDRVVFVDEYLYDLPFYAQLSEPVWVLSRWNDADIAQRDNWRKELHDALRFATAQNRSRLVPFEEAGRVTCTAGQVWWVGRQDPRLQASALSQLPGLQNLQLIHQARQVQLWRSAGQPC